jgi:hypothetical protein
LGESLFGLLVKIRDCDSGSEDRIVRVLDRHVCCLLGRIIRNGGVRKLLAKGVFVCLL